MIRKRLHRCYPKITLQPCNRKGRTDATCSRFHPAYMKALKEEISKQQAAVGEPGTPKKPLSASPARGVAPAPPLLQSRASATRHLGFPPRVGGRGLGAAAAPTDTSAEGFTASADDAEFEGVADLRDLLNQYSVRHGSDQVQQLIAAGRTKGLTIVGIIRFVLEKLNDKLNHDDPVYSVRLLIKAVNDPADLNHWARRARRSPSCFEQECGASAAKLHKVANDVRTYLSGCAKQMRGIEGYEEIAMELDVLAAATNTEINLEPLEQRLSTLEERATAIMQSRLGVEEISQIQENINARCAPWRGKMTAAQIDVLERQYYTKLLFERVGLPRLSLSYMSETRSRAA